MKVRIYTNDEIKILKQNIFIRDIRYCRELVYDPIFKLWTIMMRLDCPELSAREIFARAGIDINIVNKRLPQRRIKEWFDNYYNFGIAYFLPEECHYFTIGKEKEMCNAVDDFKNKLLNCILQRLKYHAENK
jgi:hypothetical protein